jgi:hypothetical protein
MQSRALLELRRTLQQRFPDSLPIAWRAAQTVATGVARLDGLLPAGGLPRGRLTAWAPGGGATAVLRAASVAALARGERAVWVDAAGRVAGDGWPGGPLLVRPSDGWQALAGAEELLRTGGFALVVLDGPGHGLTREAVRLSRAARAGGAAFVAVAEELPVAALRLRSRIAADGYDWVRDPFGDPADVAAVTIRVEAQALGWSGATEFRLPVVAHAQRLAVEALGDRRGARRTAAAGRPSVRSGRWVR